MIEKILIVASEKKSEKHLSTLRNIDNLLKDKIHKIINVGDLKTKDFENVDLVITIGGDGTFIKASSFINNNMPLLGINSEPDKSEGALTSLKENELHLLLDILKGEYSIDIKDRVKILLNGKCIDEHALNEVYIGTFSHFHVSRYIIKHDGKEEEHRSSGILFVTKHGSTAWYKSAGGQPYSDSNKIAFLVREPFSGNVFKPVLLQGYLNKGEKIVIENMRHDNGIVAIDSHKVYELEYGDIIEIEHSHLPLNVVVRK